MISKPNRCEHRFSASRHPDYDECDLCETFHSRVAPHPNTIYGPDYWSEKHSHSTIEEQVYNVDVHTEGGVTKNQFMLDLVASANKGAAIEIACAPGVMLKHLKESGFHTVVGLEFDGSYEMVIRKLGEHPVDLVFGMFPDSSSKLPDGGFDLIIGMDVFEHSHEPERFLIECGRLLTRGGMLALMAPMIGDAPFDERFLHPVEHPFIHSESNMREMLLDFGFDRVVFSRWTSGHESVVAIKL